MLFQKLSIRRQTVNLLLIRSVDKATEPLIKRHIATATFDATYKSQVTAIDTKLHSALVLITAYGGVLREMNPLDIKFTYGWEDE